MKYIGVVGGGKCSKDIYETAFEVGRLIAKHNFILICGGLFGVMEACCKGAKIEGGTTIGILPGDDINEKNNFVDIAIVTGIGHARNVLVAKNSYLLIAVGGEYGTLSEIALGLKMGKKVLSIKSWDIDGVIKIEEVYQISEYLQKI